MPSLLSRPLKSALPIILYMPGAVGARLRVAYWRPRLKHMGKRVTIGPGVYIQNPEHVSLGDDVWLDRNVAVYAGPPGRPERATHIKAADGGPVPGEVEIGAAVHIASGCVLSGLGGLRIGAHSGVASGAKIYSFSNHYRNLADRTDTRQYLFSVFAPSEFLSMVLGPVVIEEGCGVGINAVLLPGTHLRRGTWVASGAVVSAAFGPQVLVLGSGETRDLSHLTLTLPGEAEA